MSFSVRAGDTPSSQDSTPSRYSRRSPLLVAVPPPSAHPLTTYGYSTAEISNMYKRSAPPDPAKYKTTICRNWSSRGTCTFRGCTFAHGIEELRLRNPVLQLGNTPGSGRGNSTGSGSSLGGNSPHPPGHSRQGPALTWEQMVSLLLTNVKRRRETMLAQTEALRSLDEAYQSEEATNNELQKMVYVLQKEAVDLLRRVTERNAVLKLKSAEFPELTSKVESMLRCTESFNTLKEPLPPNVNDSNTQVEGFNLNEMNDSEVLKHIMDVLQT